MLYIYKINYIYNVKFSVEFEQSYANIHKKNYTIIIIYKIIYSTLIIIIIIIIAN